MTPLHPLHFLRLVESDTVQELHQQDECRQGQHTLQQYLSAEQGPAGKVTLQEGVTDACNETLNKPILAITSATSYD